MEKVSVVCAVFGDGNVTTIEIDPHASVLRLRAAIFEKLRFRERFLFPDVSLSLFVAKAANGAWLRKDENLHHVLQQGVQENSEFVRMYALRELVDKRNLGPNFWLEGNGVIHVLVQLPPRDPPIVGRRTIELYEFCLYHVLVEDPPPPPSAATRAQFKKGLVQAYKCAYTTKRKTKRKPTLRCMLLDIPLPAELVAATHVFPRRCAFLLEKMVGFDDIDDVKNGLLLFEPIKEAFETFQICFVYNYTSDEIRVKVLNKSLKLQRLVDNLDERQREILDQQRPLSSTAHGAQPIGVSVDMTFGDLEGRALHFRSLERPYKRCLSLHARAARAKAMREEWITETEAMIHDYASEGMSVAEKMDLFFAHMAE